MKPVDLSPEGTRVEVAKHPERYVILLFICSEVKVD